MNNFNKLDDLEKGFKEALLGMTLMASPVNADQPKEQTSKIKYDPSTLHPELKPIAHLESSDGQNMEHAPHSGGEFHTAIGALGFKPVTAYDQYSKSKHIKKLFPNLEDQGKFLEELKANPAFYNALATDHWNGLKTALGNVNKAAYAWRHGRGAAIKAPDEQINKDPYVMRYQQIYNKLKGNTATPTPNLGKSEKPMEPQKAIEKMGSIKEDNVYNYDDLLTAQQVMEGYFLRIHIVHNKIMAAIYQFDQEVGGLTGTVILDKVLLGDLFIKGFDPVLGGVGHRGKGLGVALYESIFAFVTKLKNVNGVLGNNQTAMIGSLMNKLSDKYGIKYVPVGLEQKPNMPSVGRSVQAILYDKDLANNMPKPPMTVNLATFDDALNNLVGNQVMDGMNKTTQGDFEGNLHDVVESSFA